MCGLVKSRSKRNGNETHSLLLHLLKVTADLTNEHRTLSYTTVVSYVHRMDPLSLGVRHYGNGSVRQRGAGSPR